MDREDPAYPGQREYSPVFLRIYDPLVLGLFSPLVWRCPTTYLLDPNVNVLGHASRRLQRLDVTTVEADVLKPLPLEGLFDSAALNGVLHCLPGPLSRKAAAVANVAAVLAPTGVLFGASILGDSGRHSWLARNMLRANNRRGTFDNLDDTEDGLRQILEAPFERVEMETIGSMAIFAATNPRVSSRATL
jgi:SAM-dependent methyltransferase